MSKDWKERLGVVYSTNSDFKYEKEGNEEQPTLPKEKQLLRVVIDRKQRKGKTVTLVQGFVGNEGDLKELAKLLKTNCGTGGSSKGGEIVIQGDLTDKIKNLLKKEGYKIKG